MNETAQWRGGWRVALRLATRDVRRHLGRSGLVVVLVGLPVLLLVAGNVLWSTADLTDAEKLPITLGQSQARLSRSDSRTVALPGGPRNSMTLPGAVKPVPGWGENAADQATALSALTGGTAYPISDGLVRATVGKRGVQASVLGIDAARPSAAGVVTLISGRWATGAAEVVVTRVGLTKGLPESGPMTVSTTDGASHTLTVVGVGDGYQVDWSVRAIDLIVPPGSPAVSVPDGYYVATEFLLERDRPLDWHEVVALGEYGVVAHSRAVTLDPPDAATIRATVDLPEEFFASGVEQQLGQALFAAVASVGLLLETALLAGPAFAVSAARSRRTLALAAANGATARQLRRTVLAQALVLGALAALIGAVTGSVLAVLIVGWVRTNRPDTVLGPLQLPGLSIGIVVGCAVLASVIAALIPSRGLARLDIVGVIRGASVSAPARMRTPIAGLVLAGLGTIGVFWSTSRDLGSEPNAWVLVALPLLAVGSAVCLVVGTLLLVPAILVLAARGSRAAPLSIRMALRDAARQRGRATSTVAAILAGTAVLAAILPIMATYVAIGASSYRSSIPPGHGMISPEAMSFRQSSDAELARRYQDALAMVSTIDPRLRTAVLSEVDPNPGRAMAGESGQNANPEPDRLVSALRPGCTPEDAFAERDAEWAGPDSPPGRCTSIGTFPMGRGQILVGEPDGLAARFGLDEGEAAVLRQGGILVTDAKAPDPKCRRGDNGVQGGPTWQCAGKVFAQTDIVDGQVEFVTATRPAGLDPRAGSLQITGRFRLPARAIADAKLNVQPGSWGLPLWSGATYDLGGLMSVQTAQSHGISTRHTGIWVADPQGPITAETQERLGVALEESSLGLLYVERGFEGLPWWVPAIAIGIVGLIILVATLVSTALSTVETAPLMGTFAAVGATRGTRRNLAAAQAGTLALIGTVLGTAVGLVPGIALAKILLGAGFTTISGTADADQPGPTVVIPLDHLSVPVVGVPLLAALLAWVAIRRAPLVTRRLS